MVTKSGLVYWTRSMVKVNKGFWKHEGSQFGLNNGVVLFEEVQGCLTGI